MEKLKRTYIRDVGEHIGEEIKIYGWVHTIRDQGSIKFMLIRDVTGLIQVVVTKDEGNVFDEIGRLSLESVISLVGEVKREEQAPGGIEIEAKSVEILSVAGPELPIPVVVEKGGEETEMSKRFDWRWIDLRKPDRLKIFKVWNAFEKGVREYIEKENYVQIYTPTLMSTASESGADVFEVSYFDGKAYLAQSPQFYKQMAMASGFEKVFMVGKVFRAEPSYTTRHVTEFTGWDFEISFIDSHQDIVMELERFLIAGYKKVEKELGISVGIPSAPFPQITMKEAKEKLGKVGIPSKADYDVSPEEERELCIILKEETGNDFVFLTDWPVEGRPFYHMRYEKNPKVTKSFDLLYKGVEIVTGSQREHRPDVLEKQAVEQNMPLEELQDYINFFRYGCPPHGGVGIGPARIIMKMLDLPSIKEAIFLPRDVKRLTP